jgi:flagellar assembly factor FliW
MQSVTVAVRQGASGTIGAPGSPAQAPAPESASRPGAGSGQPAEPAEVPELSFVHPMPGFAGLRRFVLVRLEAPESASEVDETADPAGDAGMASADSPLYELRSLERPDVRFLVAVPGAYFSDYDIELDDRECGDLGLTDPADALVLVMVTVGRDAASTTANLLAPLVINARTRVAAQVILTGSDWTVRAPLG